MGLFSVLSFGYLVKKQKGKQVLSQSLSTGKRQERAQEQDSTLRERERYSELIGIHLIFLFSVTLLPLFQGEKREREGGGEEEGEEEAANKRLAERVYGAARFWYFTLNLLPTHFTWPFEPFFLSDGFLLAWLGLASFNLFFF
ncbi:conserved hypothetical protein [Ricinus communis]|uniref:Uncharacterized protein n=1 Tax=Ricinus communis TaxID=3988 RepID=B9RTT8_RICCO|nr:conserved hypothetical protein [Ricinus communis]